MVDGAVAKCGVRSETMKNLDVSMHYNYELWLTHYLFHLDQIETMTNIGDVTAISNMELSDLVPEGEAYTAGQQEIGNLAPQDFIEDSVQARLSTQFSWGSRYNPPFVHSNDSISSFIATLGKQGK